MPDYEDLGPVFRKCYYISSLSLQYIILLIVLLLETFENDWDKRKLPTICNSTPRHISFILILLAAVVSIICLFYVRNSLDDLQNYGRSFHTTTAYLCSRGNSGFSESFLDIIVPIALALPCFEFPFSTFFIIIIIQFVTYYFISVSYDVFPNLSLSFLGYNIYKVKYSSKSNLHYVWGKRNHKNRFFYGKCEHVIPFKPREKSPRLGVIKEKTNHGQ